MPLKDKLKKARARFDKWRKKRHDAKPGGDRRKKLARLVRFYRDRIEALKKRIKKAKESASLLPGAPGWGGCRAVTNEVIRIVGGRAPVTSRKRWATYGNPGSDHHMSQLTADAVDFGIADAFWLADEIARKLGIAGGVNDYAHYYITFKGRRYRVQFIAANHGTAPHLHVGVRRA